MKCKFISPHRSDVRVPHETGNKYRVLSDPGGSHTKSWIKSASVLSTLLFFALSAFSSPSPDEIKAKNVSLNYYDPGVLEVQHALVLFNNVLPVEKKGFVLLPLSDILKRTKLSVPLIKKEESNKYMIFPDKTDYVPQSNLRTERINHDPKEAPEVKCSRMASGSKDDVGHPNKTENFYGNQTLNPLQLSNLINTENLYRDQRYCQGDHPLSMSSAFQLIQNLTPQNNLLWPV